MLQFFVTFFLFIKYSLNNTTNSLNNEKKFFLHIIYIVDTLIVLHVISNFQYYL